ncbi:hypothetical protein K2Z83_24980 [Oscillochloris sp. ZM17-4]|uniref:hypothetical protein n=1 Tax=Oscillochloris sp. ZM17-4 TaxID=2866714 RepID=UPI001C732968|nr:hypothetical protein [Oscillochloris sp. ZM17-4]MBX0330916.1 hypothetical protein [Oscillochloris sp. ZM17-4]
MSADELIADLAAGLAGRLRGLAAVIDRLDRLESGTGGWLATFAAGELDEAAEDLALRALRTSSDVACFAVLSNLGGSESRSLDDLIAATGMGRLLLAERLNDLVQVGLAARMIDTDHAQITPAGAAMLQLVEALAGGAAANYRAKG